MATVGVKWLIYKTARRPRWRNWKWRNKRCVWQNWCCSK